jgi:hypothetical protein
MGRYRIQNGMVASSPRISSSSSFCQVSGQVACYGLIPYSHLFTGRPIGVDPLNLKRKIFYFFLYPFCSRVPSITAV